MRYSLSAVCLLKLIVLSWSAQAGQGKLTLGYEYSRGEYGYNDITRLWYTPFSLAWYEGGTELKVSSSYLRSQGPENVVIDDSGLITTGDEQQSIVSRSGFSDAVLSIRQELDWLAASGVFIDVTAAVRLPTASQSLNYAKHSADYRVQLDAYLAYGDWLPIFGIGYRWMGDSDELATNDIWNATLGVQYYYENNVQSGLLYDYRQSSTGGESLKELMAYISYQPDKQWSLTGYLLSGYSEGSVDFGSGLQLSYRF